MTDILEAAERALAYVQGLTYEQFAADARTVDAVSYAIVVIGEAAKAVPEGVMAAAPEIPWADIRGMRNKVAHEYFGVDANVLWQTVRQDDVPLRDPKTLVLTRGRPLVEYRESSPPEPFAGWAGTGVKPSADSSRHCLPWAYFSAAFLRGSSAGFT